MSYHPENKRSNINKPGITASPLIRSLLCLLSPGLRDHPPGSHPPAPPRIFFLFPRYGDIKWKQSHAWRPHLRSNNFDTRVAFLAVVREPLSATSFVLGRLSFCSRSRDGLLLFVSASHGTASPTGSLPDSLCPFT